jgi:pimeloyl-ACP methyl ester carboxylesterase
MNRARTTRTLLGTLAGAVVAYLVLVALRGTGIRRVSPPPSRPARNREEALALFERLREIDRVECSSACASTLLEPEGGATATLVYYHGFTNCPEQSRPVSEVLRARGLRVISPRQPRHGFADRMTRALKDLTTAELVDHVNLTLDIAAGFGDPVYVIGLSGGGILAAWAAATRHEVRRVACLAPVATPRAVPTSVVRLFVRFHRWLPGWYIWWDPRTKADRVQSQLEYPGFPLPGLVPLLHLGLELGDARVRCGHRLQRAALVLNPNDNAIGRRGARRLMSRTFSECAHELRELELARGLGWQHDFIDQSVLRHGDPEQVADVFMASLGLLDRPLTRHLLSRIRSLA